MEIIVKDTDDSDDAPRVLTPSHTIKFKVKKGGAGAVTKDLLKKIDDDLEANLGDQYKGWVSDDLTAMEAVMMQIEAQDGERGERIEALRDIVHETRGMGSTFGSNLITAIGDQLYRLCDHEGDSGPGRVAAMRLHLETMKMVIAEDIREDGGQRGQEVLASLRTVYEKYG